MHKLLLDLEAQLARHRWIVSPRYDLAFFIGSCAVAFMFWGLYVGLDHLGWAPEGEHILVTYFVFTALFDQPHIFQTFSRTHYDHEEFKKRPRMHTWGIVAFITAGLIVYRLGYRGEMIVAAATYGSYHIMRQHWGLIKAYKDINGDHARLDEVMDKTMLYVGMLSAMIHEYKDLHGPTVVWRDLVAPFPAFPPWVSQGARALMVVMVVVYLGRQLWRWRTGQGLNVPKLLLLTAALGTHWFVFYFAAVPFLVAEAIETSYHNVQYHGWMMFYQRRRFAHVPRVAARWAGMALVYGVLVGMLEIFGLVYHKEWGIVFVPFTMLVIYHYYIDGKIWRFAEDPSLRAALFAAPTPKASP